MHDFQNTDTTIDFAREDFRDYLKKTILFSAFFVLSVIQVGTWGRDALPIVYYKALYLLDTAKPAQLRALSEICVYRKRYVCAAEAYDRLAAQEPLPETLLLVGNFHRSFGRHSQAHGYYKKGVETAHLGNSTSDIEAKLWYGLGKTFEAAGQGVEAAHAYGKAIAAKPEVIQVTITESYIKLLQRMNQREAAEAVIREARMRAHSQSLFSYLQNTN